MIDFSKQNITITLMGIGIIAAFAAGFHWSQAKVKPNLDKLTFQGDSLRRANKQLQADGILQALKRDTLEVKFRSAMADYDSLKKADKKTIAKYEIQLTKKLTPHEIQSDMLAIYDNRGY